MTLSFPLPQVVSLGLAPRPLEQGEGGAPPESNPPGAIFAALDSVFLFVCLALRGLNCGLWDL